MSPVKSTTSIVLIGFSDYHSHAVPFYSEGEANQGGIARTIAFLKTQREKTPNLLVLSGGDMMNVSTPIWSDEYQCTEWEWFNGLVDMMSLGNHDLDYGPDVFAQARQKIDYPLLCANFVDPHTGDPILTHEGKPYIVKEIDGIKLGLFALAGAEFDMIIRKEDRPDGAIFIDRLNVARQIVADLHEKEKVNAVILFGHGLREDDTHLVQKIGGIDIVMGTHSHYKSELIKLPGTDTWYISPYQYLTYVSRLEVTFEEGKIANVSGSLVKMGPAAPEDPEIAQKVGEMQKALEIKYPDRFTVLGTAGVELSDEHVSNDESLLGNWVVDTLRDASNVQAFFTTASSFRGAISPGAITVEAFYTAIPYSNTIVIAEMTGQLITELINLSLSKRGSDGFTQKSGVRFNIDNGKAVNIMIHGNTQNGANGYEPLDVNKVYKIGAVKFLALTAGGYKDIFKRAITLLDTKRDVCTILINCIRASDAPIFAELDGRMGSDVLTLKREKNHKDHHVFRKTKV